MAESRAAKMSTAPCKACFSFLNHIKDILRKVALCCVVFLMLSFITVLAPSHHSNWFVQINISQLNDINA